METTFNVLIVGAGHAGAQTAVLLRQNGFEGRIGVVGAEPDHPYDRPALSKDYLCGEKQFDRMLIRPTRFWEERKIEFRFGLHAKAIDPTARRLSTSCGQDFEYGTLIWAAGGTPKHLTCEGSDLGGIHVVRQRSDVDRIRTELPQIEQVVIVGGGYVGLEAAAAFRKLGKKVVLLEAQDRLLARVAGPDLAEFFKAEHLARGVDLRLNAKLRKFIGHDRVSGVELSSGERIPAQLVIIGIGIIPSVQPLLEAGAEGGDGVDVDDRCRTSVENIYAIGDCARQFNTFADRPIRLESVQNAHGQAAIVANDLVGKERPAPTVPWFWSNQYDLRLQMIGFSAHYDDVVWRGDPTTKRFSIIYLLDGKIVAMDCVNAPKDYMYGLGLMHRRAPSRISLSDTNTPLRQAL